MVVYVSRHVQEPERRGNIANKYVQMINRQLITMGQGSTQSSDSKPVTIIVFLRYNQSAGSGLESSSLRCPALPLTEGDAW
jgi:hypothetical protein